MVENDELILDIPDEALFEIYEVVSGVTNRRVVGGYDETLYPFSVKQISATQIMLRKNSSTLNTNVVIKIVKVG